MENIQNLLIQNTNTFGGKYLTVIQIFTKIWTLVFDFKYILIQINAHLCYEVLMMSFKLA